MLRQTSHFLGGSHGRQASHRSGLGGSHGMQGVTTGHETTGHLCIVDGVVVVSDVCFVESFIFEMYKNFIKSSLKHVPSTPAV